MGGGTKSFEVVLTLELEVLAIVIGGGGSFHRLKGGVQQVLPRLENKFRTCSPPPSP